MFPIFSKLGGIEFALEALERRTGRRPTPRAMKHWRSVAKLPATAIVPLMEECAQRGIVFDVNDCRLSEKATSFPRKPRGQGRAGPKAATS